MTAILAAGGGFLLAVLWMDLMFDVQVLRARAVPKLPDEMLASIAGYYRRVTSDARPMGYLIGAAMTATIVAALMQLVRGEAPLWVSLTSLALCGVPMGLAGLRVYPNAVRLGTRADSLSQQSDLARAICRDHLVCLAAMVAFLCLQLSVG